MNKSDSIGALAAALSKLQGEIQDIYKDRSGYGYKYADLAGVLEVVRPLCAKYELAVTQLCTNLGDLVGVETVLTHSSGEWISSTLYMPLSGGKGMSAAQAAGSVITYARRYSLAAILGVAQTDTDATTKVSKHYEQLEKLIDEMKLHDSVLKWCAYFKVEKLSDLNDEQTLKIIANIKEKTNEQI